VGMSEKVDDGDYTSWFSPKYSIATNHLVRRPETLYFMVLSIVWKAILFLIQETEGRNYVFFQNAYDKSTKSSSKISDCQYFWYSLFAHIKQTASLYTSKTQTMNLAKFYYEAIMAHKTT